MVMMVVMVMVTMLRQVSASASMH